MCFKKGNKCGLACGCKDCQNKTKSAEIDEQGGRKRDKITVSNVMTMMTTVMMKMTKIIKMMIIMKKMKGTENLKTTMMQMILTIMQMIFDVQHYLLLKACP